jgi:hypothetical protein
MARFRAGFDDPDLVTRKPASKISWIIWILAKHDLEKEMQYDRSVIVSNL